MNVQLKDQTVVSLPKRSNYSIAASRFNLKDQIVVSPLADHILPLLPHSTHTIKRAQDVKKAISWKMAPPASLDAGSAS